MKGIYLFAFMMFLGIVIMVYSSYRMMNIIEERSVAGPSGAQSKEQNPQAPSIMITDPDIQPYLTGSVLGLAFFIVGAVGGLIAIIKAFTRRF